MSVDGNYAIVGACYDDDYGTDSGSVYVYELGTSTEQKLTASDGAEGDQFGYSVSIDGNYAIVGARYDDDYGTDSGSVYVYELGTSTEQKLTASDGAEGDQFGYSVSIDGNYAIVGARYDDDNGSNSGAAYIYQYTDGVWTQKRWVLAHDGSEGDQFGYSVSIDGNYAIVGACLDDSHSGSAYIFLDNYPPWDTSLDDNRVEEDQPVGTVVGTFSTTDPDNADTHTYTLVQGTGDNDNDSFTLETDGTLKTAEVFDYDTESGYTIRVRTTDRGGLWSEEAFTIAIITANEQPNRRIPEQLDGSGESAGGHGGRDLLHQRS